MLHVNRTGLGYHGSWMMKLADNRVRQPACTFIGYRNVSLAFGVPCGMVAANYELNIDIMCVPSHRRRSFVYCLMAIHLVPMLTHHRV
jgi:hypothetical protein